MTLLRRRRFRALQLRVRRGFGRHYVSLISATVLAVAASQALTGSGFEGDRGLARSSGTEAVSGSAAQAVPASAFPAVPTSSVSSATPGVGASATIASVTERMRLRARQRRLALVYLVMNDTQGREVVQTYRTLIWDMPAPETMRPVTVEYIIADTLEAEAAAVQLLNGLVAFVNQHEVDLRIIDLRPERRPAMSGTP